MSRAPRCSAAFLCLLLLPACTKRIDLDLSSPAPAFTQANAALGNGSVDITLTDGQFVQWRAVQISPDLTTGLPLGSALPTAGAIGDRPALKTNFVAVIKARSRGKGALQGALFGAAAGAVLGLIVSPEAMCTEGDTSCPQTKAESFAMATTGGAVWGVIIGAIRAARTEIWMRE